VLVFSGYQAVVIRSLSAVRQVNLSTVLPETRGDAAVVDSGAGGPLLLALPIPTGSPQPSRRISYVPGMMFPWPIHFESRRRPVTTTRSM